LYGETTRLAPARQSFFSESSSLARATIVMSGRSSRTVRVMKMFYAGHHPGGAPDPRQTQDVVVGRRPLDERGADRLGRLAAVGVRVDDDEGTAGGSQVAGDLAPDAPEPADQMVVAERLDHPPYPPLGEQAAEVAGDEELGHRHQPIEERTHAEHDQQHLDDLSARRLRLGDRADGRDRVKGPDEPESDRGPLRDHEADGP